MPRVKIQLADNIKRVVVVDTDATAGAQLGTDLRVPGGAVGTPATVRQWLGVTGATSGGSSSFNFGAGANGSLWRLVGGIPQWAPPTDLFANPSATFGANMAGANGSAATGLRSDAVLKIDPAIVPTWTGFHTFNALALKQSATAPVLVNGDAIATAAVGESRVAPAGNVTGIILEAGTSPGQIVSVANESAFTVTMAAAGTSNVAEGVSCVVAANKSTFFVWDSVTARWYAAGGGGAGGASPLTTKGDLYTYSTLDARLPVGTNGYQLVADSAETTGLKWIANLAQSAPSLQGASFSAGSAALVAPTNKVPVYIREDCTIAGVVVLTQGGTGDCVLDILKSAFGAYPPSASICAAAKPTIVADDTYIDTTLTGWTTALSAGDTLLVNLDSSSVFTEITMYLILLPVGTTPTSGYDDERARDAIAAALTDTATVLWTYDDTANTIEGDVDTTALDLFTSTDPGIVPASSGLSTEYLSADGTYSVPAGGGGSGSSGTYTPTITSSTNVSSVTARKATWIRQGDVVTVTGSFDPTTTTGSATSSVLISLPVASNLGTVYDVAGTIGSANANPTGAVGGFQGDVALDVATALFKSQPTGAAGDHLGYTFSYEVLP